MYLACDEIAPGNGCDFIAQGDDADSVVVALLDHRADVHADWYEGQTSGEVEAANVETEAYIRSLL